jgi:four helix bundle protein
MAVKTYRELTVRQRGVELVEFVYGLTRTFPSQEKYGLASQLQRAAVSIAANIAEGYGRLHRPEYVHHLSIARGSLFEVETLLTIARRLKLITRQQALEAWTCSQEVGRMLTRMIATLRKP